jgi:hypothetical protein
MQRLENSAVRIMYFLNVIDSFLPFSVLALLLCQQAGILAVPAILPAGKITLAGIVVFGLIWACFKVAEFHVLYLASFLILIPLLLASHSPVPGNILLPLAFFFCLTSVIQVMAMGLPLGVASRSPMVPIRLYLNSFAIIAPTTISLGVTLGYQLTMVTALSAFMANGISILSSATAVALMLAAFLVRRIRKYCYVPPIHHPQPGQRRVKRVFLLNVDGLSYHVFKKADAPFLHYLENNFLHAEGGATTIYQAFTNPAFASILTGAEPKIHGVFNNNFGQTIKVQALPDILKTRLYGSMHVKHFSRSDWVTTIVSLVINRYDRADDVMMEKVKKDVLDYPDTELWVVDLSMADFCGHAWGAYSKEHYRAVSKLDALIKDFFEWCGRQNLLEDSLYLIGSDHGNFIAEHAFLLSKKEEYVPLIFVGKDVALGTFKDKVSILDISANVTFAMGRTYCKASGGRVFDSLFSYPGDRTLAERLGLI